MADCSIFCIDIAFVFAQCVHRLTLFCSTQNVRFGSVRLADIPNSEFAASSSLDMSDTGSQESVGPPLKGWTVVTQSGNVEVSE